MHKRLSEFNCEDTSHNKIVYLTLLINNNNNSSNNKNNNKRHS